MPYLFCFLLFSWLKRMSEIVESTTSTVELLCQPWRLRWRQNEEGVFDDCSKSSKEIVLNFGFLGMKPLLKLWSLARFAPIAPRSTWLINLHLVGFLEWKCYYFFFIIKVQPLVNSGVCEGEVAVAWPWLGLVYSAATCCFRSLWRRGCYCWPLTWPCL